MVTETPANRYISDRGISYFTAIGVHVLGPLQGVHPGRDFIRFFGDIVVGYDDIFRLVVPENRKSNDRCEGGAKGEQQDVNDRYDKRGGENGV